VTSASERPRRVRPRQPSKRALQEQRLRQDLRRIGLEARISQAFFKEILYAIHPPIHERRTPLFGALASLPYEARSRLVGGTQLRLPFPISADFPLLWRTSDLPLARQMADGHKTMLVVDDTQRSVEIRALPDGADELTFVQIQDRYGLSAIQRTGSGKVKVFLPEALLVHERNSWMVKPYSRDMVWPIADFGDRATAQRLLDLAVHVLSPSNTGATLAWCPDGQVDSTALDLTGSHGLAPVPLQSHDAYALIRSLASQNDRALVFGGRGELVRVGVSLRWDEAANCIPPTQGTRHTSALRASSTDPTLVLVVISEDGPVRVFIDGHNVASFSGAEFARVCEVCAGAGEIVAVSEHPLPDWPAVEVSAAGTSSGDEATTTSACSACSASGRVWSTGPILRGRSRNLRPVHEEQMAVPVQPME
jgi:hypothetical protein